MEIGIWLKAQGWEKGSAQIKQFSQASTSELGRLRASMQATWHEFNGFSIASKLAAMAGGAALLKNTLDANLDFEKELKGSDAINSSYNTNTSTRKPSTVQKCFAFAVKTVALYSSVVAAISASQNCKP